MGMFDRMGKVISSNLNAMLDRAQDDRRLMELNLEEMGEQLKAGRQDVISALASEKQLRKRVEQARLEADQWDKRAELALKTDDEALAREALKQKKRCESDAAVAERAHAEQRDVVLSMKAELERMERKLEEVTLRKQSIAAKAAQARQGGTLESLGARGGSNAFENFRRMEDEIAGREQQNLAMQEVEDALGTRERVTLEDKFRQLERGGHGGKSAADAAIDDELAALKKRIRV